MEIRGRSMEKGSFEGEGCEETKLKKNSARTGVKEGKVPIFSAERGKEGCAPL